VRLGPCGPHLAFAKQFAAAGAYDRVELRRFDRAEIETAVTAWAHDPFTGGPYATGLRAAGRLGATD
jgi:hypothetical protein